MDKYIFDESNGLWYELRGDYYFPCLTLPAEESQPAGIWGMRHLQHIKEYRKGFYTSLRLSGKLNNYLSNINQEAEDMVERLVKEMVQRQGITEKLKAKDQLAWVGAMNNIRNAAEEIVKEELIYA